MNGRNMRLEPASKEEVLLPRTNGMDGGCYLENQAGRCIAIIYWHVTVPHEVSQSVGPYATD